MGLDMAEYIYGDIQILRATGEPCIVCGHPNGGCAPEGHEPPEKLIGLGLFKSVDEKQTFQVMEDFFLPEEVSPGVFAKVRKFSRGQVIPLSEARKYNLTRN